MTVDLYRVLRDIRDGHLNLWVTVARFDVSTGAAVPPTEIETSPDRTPSAAAGNGVHWWRVLAEQGWIRLPDLYEHSVWQLTEKALAAILEHEAES